MNWLLIGIGLVFVLGVIWGAWRGLIKVAATLVAAILSIVLVIFLNPYVSKAVKKWTPLDDMIEKKCVEIFLPSVSQEVLENADLSQLPLTEYQKQQLQNNTDLSSLGLGMDDIAGFLGEIPKDTQIKLIEDSELPEFLKTALLENNNSEIYGKLGVKTFPEYISTYASNVVVSILSFVITFLLVWILIRAFIAVADLLSFLPIIHGLNTAAGAVLGGVLALLFIWIIFLVLTLVCATDAGKPCLEMINESGLLRFLYEHNVLLKMLI